MGFEIQVTESESFLNREEFKEKPVEFEIVELQEPVDNQWGRKDFPLRVQNAGNVYKLTLWQRHINLLAGSFGTNSAEWQGKKILVSAEPVIAVDGQTKLKNGNIQYGWVVKSA